MSITIGGKTPQSISIGGKAVASLSINGEVVWSDTPSGPDYFYIENAYNGQNTITVKLNVSNIIVLQGPPRTTDLAYSKDGQNWTNLNLHYPGQTYITLEANEKVYFRSSTGLSMGGSIYCHICFYGNKAHKAGGKLSTLIDYTDPSSVTTVRSGEFAELLSGSPNLIDVSDLDWDNITTLESGALEQMCYANIYLTSGLDLSNITTTTIDSCSKMYSGCSSLTTAYAPNVSAWTDNNFTNWLRNVSASGTVYAPAGLAITTSSNNGIPSGWAQAVYPS